MLLMCLWVSVAQVMGSTPASLLERGYALEQQGQPVGAIQLYRQALAERTHPEIEKRIAYLTARLTPAQQAELLLWDGYALEQGGNIVAAIRMYEEAARILPDPRLTDRIASLRAERTRHEQAEGGRAAATLDLPRPDQEPLPEVVERTKELLVAGLAFSMKARTDFASASQDYGAGNALSFVQLDDITPARSMAWSSFFANGFMLPGHLGSSRIAIAYYHPFYDVVLLTAWEMINAEPRMVAADLRIASELKTRASAELPDYPSWLDAAARTPVPEVLKRRFHEFSDAFSRMYPPGAEVAAPIMASHHAQAVAQYLEKNALASLADVLQIQLPGERYIKTLYQFRTALEIGDRETLRRLVPDEAPTGVDSLLSLSREKWAGFVPVYAITNQTDSLVMLQAPFNPEYVLLAVFRHGEDWNRPWLGSVVFFELTRELGGAL